jgi:glycosyltransferase involved in cell wall biosynthesis
MLIPIDTVKKYLNDIQIKGVLHIGAHDCEELPFYSSMGCNEIVWIDAIEDKVQENRNKGIQNIFQAVISDVDDVPVKFNITNNVQSSSFLEFGTHATNYTWCKVIKSVELLTSRLDTFVKRHAIPIQKLNFWNLDIQGAELLALKGGSDFLQYVDLLYIEVNTEEVYKGCPHVREIDAFLYTHGFGRAETLMDNSGWGDAIYIRVPPLKISVCIPTMDRWSFLKKSLPDYFENPFIDEIIISDENGNDCREIFNTYGPHPKLKLYSNTKCLGAYLNKQKAVSFANNKWVALLDSDNFAPLRYFIMVARILDENISNIIYLPSRTLPTPNHGGFDYREYIGTPITINTVSELLLQKQKNTECLLQTANYVFCKEFFLSCSAIYGLENQCSGMDAFLKNYILLKGGATLKVVKDMEYSHAVHNGSITLQNMSTSYVENKPIFYNLFFGLSPFRMTLRHWQCIKKPVYQWLVNCSEFDRQEDGMVQFPIGMSHQIVNYNKVDLGHLVRGPHSKLVFCSIYPTTDERRRGSLPVNRKRIIDILAKNGISNGFEPHNVYLTRLREFKFVVSPEGNGIDTHRHYESLMMGCIPIAEENAHIRDKYGSMPVLYTFDYSEITPAYLEKKYVEMLDTVYDFSKLFLDFYDADTQAQIKANSDYWCNRCSQKTFL